MKMLYSLTDEVGINREKEYHKRAKSGGFKSKKAHVDRSGLGRIEWK